MGDLRLFGISGWVCSGPRLLIFIRMAPDSDGAVVFECVFFFASFVDLRVGLGGAQVTLRGRLGRPNKRPSIQKLLCATGVMDGSAV